jgi:UDP-N-acetylglucosamine transferase subunit ALG13
MLPFDRFVRAVDEWARDNPDRPVFIQIGDGEYEPQHAPWARIIEHKEYRERLAECRLFVAHVGMGSILQALELRKQMLLLPRHASLREHTTDHQLHTATQFGHIKGLKIVDDADALKAGMTELVETPLAPSDGLSPYAPKEMTDNVAYFLRTGKSPLKRDS